MDDKFQHWEKTNDHPQDLMEMMEGELLDGNIDRKWRLFLCAIARHVLPIATFMTAFTLVEVAEAFADGDLLVDELKSASQVHYEEAVLGEHKKLLLSQPESEPDGRRWCANCAVNAVGFIPLSTRTSFHGSVWAVDAAFRAISPSEAFDIEAHSAAIFKDIFLNPFQQVAINPEWRTTEIIELSQQMYDSRQFSHMLRLEERLRDVGCTQSDILDHCLLCTHVRGCWLVDLLLEK